MGLQRWHEQPKILQNAGKSSGMQTDARPFFIEIRPFFIEI
jgi:hypothetical protein